MGCAYIKQDFGKLPKTDLLTLLFESMSLHFSAANPEIYLTKAMLHAFIERIAYFLRHTLPGQPAAPAAFFGTIAAGGVVSSALHSSTSEELTRQIQQGKSGVLIVSGDKVELGRTAAELARFGLDRVVVLSSEPRWEERCLEGEKNVNVENGERMTGQRVTDEDELKRSLIVLLYSSETTGSNLIVNGTGVVLSCLNPVAQLYIPSVQARAHIASFHSCRRPTTHPLPSARSRTLVHLPIAHIAGVAGYIIGPLFNGGAGYWMPKFSWKPFLEYTKTLRITDFYMIPSIYLGISRSSEVTDQFDTVGTALTSAAPRDAHMQPDANARPGRGKMRISQAWGLSETTGVVTAMPRGSSDTTNSISPILPNMEICLVDDSYQDVTPGQLGELIVRGPFVSNEYFDNEDATKSTFYHDWFCTGDIAVGRAGKLYIGLQIAPAEIENLFITHPDILEAAMVGMPIEGGSEVPRAYVVSRDKGVLGKKDIRGAVKRGLAAYKQLRGWGEVFGESTEGCCGEDLEKSVEG
ncbi:acetyl-CoA synthetase-like protein [Amniculicola lignicola CBS 123094]|uniref:Acetyl-CoA synthetase-like protein n=1 Tax=Amniculicola lignicola CBS 123094 TaxID=1392246 RepID=A0A6A5VUZ3_9PLEO|nr:acetyl-CoA synthetase-like protein [Amniculicola lignicola CBS 123094]